MKMFHRILTETFGPRFFDDFRKVRNGAGSERATPLKTNIGSKYRVHIGATASSKNAKTYTWRGFREGHTPFGVKSFWGNPRGPYVPPPLGGDFWTTNPAHPVVKHKIQSEKQPQRGVGEEAGRKGFRLKTEK